MKKREVCSHFLYLQTLARASKLPGRHVRLTEIARTPSAYQPIARSIRQLHDRFPPLRFVRLHLFRKNLPIPAVRMSARVWERSLWACSMQTIAMLVLDVVCSLLMKGRISSSNRCPFLDFHKQRLHGSLQFNLLPVLRPLQREKRSSAI